MYNPDAIIILSGGTVADTKPGSVQYRSSTYEDSDAFGVLGGRARVEAAAILAQQYAQASIVATSRRLDGGPSAASTVAHELQELGVPAFRIMLEEESTNTQTALAASAELALVHQWKSLMFVTNEYHVPRASYMWQQSSADIQAQFVPAEAVLNDQDPAFALQFSKIVKLPSYAQRVASEKAGLEALHSGMYHVSPSESKLER